MNQDFLKQTTLFEKLTDQELVEIILIGNIKSYKRDQVIFREGDPGDTIFLIVKGTVRISKVQNGAEEALAVLDPKSFFGEMTIFDNDPRSAHAIANEDLTLFAINTQELIKLFERNKEIGYKFLWAFGRTLTERLRSTNEKFQVMMCLANSGF